MPRLEYKEAKEMARDECRVAMVVSNVLSPSKYDVGQKIYIAGLNTRNPHLLWTNTGALVDVLDVEFIK